MASLRTTTNFLVREIFRPSIQLSTVRFIHIPPAPFQATSLVVSHRLLLRTISFSPVRCAAASDGGADDGKKSPARLSQVKQLLHEATERAQAAGNDPIPKITIDHVIVNFARSGGPGGQNVNKVNTKVDMRFNVKNAYWLSDRVREKILQMEKNRINKDGELVFRGNIEDALNKLQAIIDAASYVPPPPSEEQVKRIAKLAAIGERKRLDNKKAQSQKKAMRRSKDSWD
uniref:Peptidyl-tRNA hydrolase ICT1, mitochondrial n=1 Tax=Nicotiana tabacum TaxID=4097 RepID=A0A1S4BB93_TOBAC|nr:PREDICTED: peptidyl-tRNA hydrolase ICT1, mitochondrial-like [Nicotiana tabacum]